MATTMTTTPDTPRKKRFPAIALTLLTLLLLGYVIWYLDTAPRTDDAYAYADTIEVVSEVSGKIIDLPIQDNQAVKQGDLLFQIDPRPYQASLDEARARLVELDKQIELTQRSVNAEEYNAAAALDEVKRARAVARQAADTLNRMKPLLSEGYVSAEEVDQAKTAQHSSQVALQAALQRSRAAAAAVSGVDALVAQRVVVEAQIARAELHLEFTTVRAPFDGRVVSLDTSVGQYASALKPVFTLIDTRHWYVVANFRESELKNMHSGTHSTVYLMTNPDKQFQGTVDSIGYGVHPDDGGTTFGGLPNVKRTLNWVRVAQRFPVKILVEDPDPDLFRIGASAVVVLHPARNPRDRELGTKNTDATLIGAAVDNNTTMDNNTDTQEQAMRTALAQSEAPSVKREMEVLSLTLKGDVSFDANSAALKPVALDEINRVAVVLKQYPQSTILVAGHTDSIGAEDKNQELSERRAESVKSALVGQGIAPMRVTTVGYGEAKSIATNDTPEGRQLNRRVEIRIQSQQG